MQVVRGSNPEINLVNNKIKTAVTIGNFDGIHLGHRFVFDKLFEIADKKNLTKTLITFEPRPVDFFSKDSNKHQVAQRLTLLSDKLEILKKIGFDLVWVMNFNNSLANQLPDNFVEKIINKLNIEDLLIGEDFRFGKKRAGDVGLLKQYADANKFNLDIIKDYNLDSILSNSMVPGLNCVPDEDVKDIRISSSYIRELLLEENIEKLNANFKRVNNLLSRNYGFSGKVVQGQQKGRELGYPTVNINIKPKQLILSRGVYLVNIIYNNKKYSAMANWGYRPTVANKLDLVLEAHIFNFNQDIYNKKIYIEFLAKIRDEKKFESIDELKNQLDSDAKLASDYFKVT